jgi:hypothetical protein
MQITRLTTIAALLLCGCSPSKEDGAAAITAFLKNCDTQVSAELKLSSFGNDMTMRCARFKTLEEVK